MEGERALLAFKRGIKFLRDGYPAEALECMRRASELEQQNPYYLSFLGVSVARAQKDWQAATRLCETALSSKRDEAQLYLNLAEIYVSAGRRDDAVTVLDKALSYCPRDARIKRMRGELGRRQAPVLPFLGREHRVNRSLGNLRHKISERLHKSQG
jgi:Flp pilus assembly protein TadD